ncbi:hypothetical protein Hanom_Chr06g00557211 [Helianthus anomalus]
MIAVAEQSVERDLAVATAAAAVVRLSRRWSPPCGFLFNCRLVMIMVVIGGVRLVLCL